MAVGPHFHSNFYHWLVFHALLPQKTKVTRLYYIEINFIMDLISIQLKNKPKINCDQQQVTFFSSVQATSIEF
ncbi:MAG: hypothetical protein ACTSQI_17550 [Candidatus Helarchaeota archaeon]